MILLLNGCAPQRSYEAALILADTAAREAPSRWKSTTPTPSQAVVTYTVAGRTHRGTLYLPTAAPPQAGIVLVPGIVPLGKDDPRLVAFANTLARARFAVLTPALKEFKHLQVRPRHPRVIADALAYLAKRPDLVPPDHLGIGAFSFSVGLAVIASLEEDIRTKVQFIFGVGGYYDLETAIRFFTTGYLLEDEHYLEPSQYGKLVFAATSLKYLTNPTDHAVLREMIHIKIRNPDADITFLASRLGPQGKAVYSLLNNTDPAQVSTLIQALPQGLQRLIENLSLSNQNLTLLQAQIILVHGKDDPLIPYTESITLANALSPKQTQLYIIEQALSHVDFKFRSFFTPAFWSRELPDLWRMYRAIYLLLEKRAPTDP
ncbi:alpha/beta hydrolase [Nitrosococcus wardiae]|uniref:alpha/beta hydrolase n=1 Tax=Nitrosococcus wardiae TaxID=1814290 RepID=UPI001F0E06A6|nr:alpha/beta hydrolase [Nitrosococcus wardiae]